MFFSYIFVKKKSFSCTKIVLKMHKEQRGFLVLFFMDSSLEDLQVALLKTLEADSKRVPLVHILEGKSRRTWTKVELSCEPTEGQKTRSKTVLLPHAWGSAQVDGSPFIQVSEHSKSYFATMFLSSTGDERLRNEAL